MKKKLISAGIIAALCITTLFAMTGCKEKEYDYDLSEYVEVGEYKNLEYDKISVSVSDEEVQEEIENILKQAVSYETEKEGIVKDGDTIDISYKGKVDGKDLENGSADNQKVTIGTTKFIDGFLEGLVGKNIGDTVTLDLKFPEEYPNNPDVAGKPVTFKVTINSREVEVTPEYNMDFIKNNTDFKSKEEYEKSLRKEILDKKTEDAKMQAKQSLWVKVIDKSKATKYPEKELNEVITQRTEAFKKLAENEGMEWNEYLKQIGYSEEDFNKVIKQYAEDKVFQDMVAYSIAEKEGIEVTDDEYDKYLQDVLKASGFTEKTFKDNYQKSIEEYAEQEGWRSLMLVDKVADKIMEYAKEK